jgi:hypothetical protein
MMKSGKVAFGLGGGSDEIRSLASWLRDDDDVRGQVTVSQSPPASGHMGGALEAVVVVLTSGTASAVFTALFDWLKHKRESRKVSVKVHDGSGRELEVSCGSSDDLNEVIGSVRAFLDSGA